MKYELWEYDHGHSFLEVAGDEAAYLDRIRQLKMEEPEARQTWTVEAENYNQAMQLLYDRKGWGRYRTIEEDLGEAIDPSDQCSGSGPESG